MSIPVRNPLDQCPSRDSPLLGCVLFGIWTFLVGTLYTLWFDAYSARVEPAEVEHRPLQRLLVPPVPDHRSLRQRTRGKHVESHANTYVGFQPTSNGT